MASDSILLVRQIAQGDRDWVAQTLVQEWTSTSVARLGELVEAVGLSGYLATRGGRRVGLVLVDVRDRGYEVVALAPPSRGVASGGR